MMALFLVVGPLLLIASLAGYGAALTVALGGRGQIGDFFEAAFKGLFLVTAAVLAVNFFAGIGTVPAPYVLGLGLVLFAIFRWRDDLTLSAPGLLAMFVASGT